MSRIVCWFSCGAASAVATKLAITKNAGRLPLVIARCYVAEEHEDNDRFARDCEAWFGQPIEVLADTKFGASIYRVFEKERYIVGARGAPCSRALKRRVIEKFRRPNDLNVYGFTVEEQDRHDRIIDSDNLIAMWPVLIEAGLTKSDCLAMVERAGIELPVMYRLGYGHNNCVGCVKGGQGYWNRIRVDFPSTFARMAKLERKIGAPCVKKDGVRHYLDELAPDAGRQADEPAPQCGIFCDLAEAEIKAA